MKYKINLTDKSKTPILPQNNKPKKAKQCFFGFAINLKESINVY